MNKKTFSVKLHAIDILLGAKKYNQIEIAREGATIKEDKLHKKPSYVHMRQRNNT